MSNDTSIDPTSPAAIAARRGSTAQDMAAKSRTFRTAARSASDTRRYTVDLPLDLHRALKMFSLMNDVEASKVIRAAIARLDTDTEFANKILADIYGDNDASPDEA